MGDDEGDSNEDIDVDVLLNNIASTSTKASHENQGKNKVETSEENDKPFKSKFTLPIATKSSKKTVEKQGNLFDNFLTDDTAKESKNPSNPSPQFPKKVPFFKESKKEPASSWLLDDTQPNLKNLKEQSFKSSLQQGQNPQNFQSSQINQIQNTQQLFQLPQTKDPTPPFIKNSQNSREEAKNKVNNNVVVDDDIRNPSGLPLFLDKLTSGVPINSEIEPNLGRRKVILNKKIDGKGMLSLPSHLIDEEELKMMSSGLKELYSSQNQLLKNSYLEHIGSLKEFYETKEVILKNEIKNIHADYEERMTRLKNELSEAESRKREEGGLSSLQSSLDYIKSQNETIISYSSQSSFELHSKALSNLIELTTSSLKKTLTLHLDENFENLTSLSNSQLGVIKESRSEIDEILQKLATISVNIAQKKELNGENNYAQLMEIKKLMEEEFKNVAKDSKRLREAFLKSLIPLNTSLTEESFLKRDKNEKISSQLKDFRQEFQKVLIELERNSEITKRAYSGLEMSQKEQFQNLHSTLSQLERSNSDFLRSPPPPKPDIYHQNEVRILNEERVRLQELTSSFNLKLNELERERIKNGHISEEFRFKNEELERNRALFLTEVVREREKLHVETKELEKEREFLEKLRVQLLCPSCLNSGGRSRGDGGENRNLGGPMRESHVKIGYLEREERAIRDLVESKFKTIDK